MLRHLLSASAQFKWLQGESPYSKRVVVNTLQVKPGLSTTPNNLLTNHSKHHKCCKDTFSQPKHISVKMCFLNYFFSHMENCIHVHFLSWYILGDFVSHIFTANMNCRRISPDSCLYYNISRQPNEKSCKNNVSADILLSDLLMQYIYVCIFVCIYTKNR